MATRRLVLGGAAIAATAAVGAGWVVASRRESAAAYERAVQRTWGQDEGVPDGLAERLRRMVRDATLAASSHNTQCWKFRVRGTAISILPDFSRRLPVVDPDDHHLLVSVGCATENLLLAGQALGLRGEPRLASGETPSLHIELADTRPAASPLFEAIPRRQSTRGLFDGKPLASQDLGKLELAGTGPGVRVHLLTERAAMEKVLELVVQGNTAQLRNPAFVAELKQWVRYDGAHAARTGDGLYAAASGNPTLPEWLGRRMFDIAVSERSENAKYVQHVRSSAGIAVFVSERDDARHWIEAGRAFQRFALQATSLGVRTAHLNQPVEVAGLRPELMKALALGPGRPDLVVRFGHGPELPQSLRRPLEAVLI